MAQGELYHLPDPSQLVLKAADVLVGRALLLLGGTADGLVEDHEAGAVNDLDDAVGHGVLHLEREGASHEGDALDDDGVALHHRTLEEASLDEGLDARPELDAVVVRHHGCQDDLLGGLDVGPGNLHVVPEGRAHVLPDQAVDADDALVLVLGQHAPHDGGGGPLSLYLDDVARGQVQLHPRLGVDAGLALSHIRLHRLGHGQVYLTHSSSSIQRPVQGLIRDGDI